MTVGDIARTEVAQAAPDDAIGDVVATMTDLGVGSIVVAEGGRPVGIITDRDLVIRVYGADADPAATTAREVMSDDLVTIGEDAGVFDLVRTMAREGVRRVPVVDDAGTLVGIVTLDDVVILLSMELQAIETLIRSESPPFEVSASELIDTD